MAHLLGGLLILVVFTATVGRFLTAADAPTQADAIVVLAGNVYRTRHAVDLFSQGYAPLVVFSDTTLKDVGLACSSAQMSLADAQELGLPVDVTMIADEAESTYDKAINVRRLAQEHGWRSLIVVTDPFHVRRASRTFRALMPEVDIHLSAAPNPDYDAARWWQTEKGLKAVFNEVVKLVFYWAKYGIVPFGA